jgi:hypothetical protein
MVEGGSLAEPLSDLAAAAEQPGGRPHVRSHVAVGIKIADAEGLRAVSMRRVASELGVATMSLYSLSEFALDTLDGLGLDHQTTLTAYITLINYVRGTACIQPGAGGGGRSHDRRRHREVDGAQESKLRSLVEGDEFPVFTRHVSLFAVLAVIALRRLRNISRHALTPIVQPSTSTSCPPAPLG